MFLNITLPSLKRYARAGFLNSRAERDDSRKQIEALELRPADPDRPAITLSGGNQQKAHARSLAAAEPRCCCSTSPRAASMSARAEIYALIHALAAAGNAVVIVSSEIEEVLGLADTSVLVINEGEVLRTAPASRTHRTRGARPRHERKRRMSEQLTTAAAPAESKPQNPVKRLFSGSGSLLIGLVVALVVLVIFGAIASPDNFPTTGNMLTSCVRRRSSA